MTRQKTRAAKSFVVLSPLTVFLSSLKVSSGLSFSTVPKKMPVLYCKPSKDGLNVGDCPFTQFARMAMEVAGKDYELKPTKKDEKPAWLLEDHGGAMPCLFMDEGALADSGKIAEAALPPNAEDLKSKDATSSLFGAIARFIKNTDDDKDPDLLKNLGAQLIKLEKRLEEVPYLSGDAIGLTDCSVSTKLYVLLVAGKHFKKFELSEPAFPLTTAYVAKLFDSDVFKKTMYPEEEMLHGWAEARAGAH